MLEYFWLIPIPVLLTGIIIFLFGKQLGLKCAWVGALGTGTSFVLSLCALPAVLAGETASVTFTWFNSIQLGFIIDPLTITMLLLVSFLATLIIIYAHGYMHGEDGLMRFFAEVQLFAFSMLGVVIADNLLQAYIMWEIMGLCSYLLIGFWFIKPEAAYAAKKAFLTTKVGDIFLFIGILILFTQTGSFAYSDIFAAIEAGTVSQFWLTAAALGIFGGVVGKSAQFPLHVWLPDAMAGPTPVSALIHAATMVKAGVYLVARMFPLFAVAPVATDTMLVIGGITALITALLAVVQTDFKKILAYSTLSQLGFMVVALGSLNWVAALLHLVNHAFFKALLFLGAGSVIHGTATNNIFEMGGVWKYQKLTAIPFLMATISIAGIPPFSGFWSKDLILASALETNTVIFALLAIATFLTAFYMFRLFYVVFTGKKRTDYPGHESCASMVWPLWVLGIFAIGSGVLTNPLTEFLTGAPAPHEGVNGVMIASVIIALAGILFSTCFYYWQVFSAEKVKNSLGAFYRFLCHRYYIDDFYDKIICGGLVVGFARISRFIDVYIIDGIVNLLAKVFYYICLLSKIVDYSVIDGVIRGLCSGIMNIGGALKKSSTGYIQQYMTLVIGAIVVMILLVWGGVL